MVFHHVHGALFRRIGEKVEDNKLRFIHNAGKSIADKAATVETVYSQVYVTESKTFAGAAGYTTEYANSAATAKPATTSTRSLDSAQASYASAKSLANKPQRASTRTSQFGAAATTSGAAGSPLHTSHGPSAVAGTPLSATQPSNPDLISQKSPGMSGGAKAGVAFGVIIAIALCAGLIFFCWRRRKNEQAGHERLDEKHASKNSFFGGTAAAVGAPAGNLRASIHSEKSFHSSRTASTAPRLSLRPVTQFLPNIMGGEVPKTTGNNLNVPAMSEKPKSTWERRPQPNEQNPFTDAAVLTDKQAQPESPPANPFEDGDGAIVAAERGTSSRSTPCHSQKNSWEGSQPATPAKFGTAAAVPITATGAAGGPQARGPNNVHRVQLDFKPSMDDELELRSGQLVRMLHEYDDGWALCMRMDRSQQGVCPRTCLSKLPVKPRPQGPPPNGPQGRPKGPPPPGMRGPPPPGSNGMYPRPLTPNGRERSQTLDKASTGSPAPRESGRPRSHSANSLERPVSPIEATVPARKPVPGQAL